MQYVYFKELPVGTLFSLNGTRFSKRSSRTAALVEFDRWFYFGQKDLCVVTHRAHCLEPHQERSEHA